MINAGYTLRLVLYWWKKIALLLSVSSLLSSMMGDKVDIILWNTMQYHRFFNHKVQYIDKNILNTKNPY